MDTEARGPKSAVEILELTFTVVGAGGQAIGWALQTISKVLEPYPWLMSATTPIQGRNLPSSDPSQPLKVALREAGVVKKGPGGQAVLQWLDDISPPEYE